MDTTYQYFPYYLPGNKRVRRCWWWWIRRVCYSRLSCDSVRFSIRYITFLLSHYWAPQLSRNAPTDGLLWGKAAALGRAKKKHPIHWQFRVTFHSILKTRKTSLWRQDGNSKLILSDGTYILNYTASHPRTLYFSLKIKTGNYIYWNVTKNYQNRGTSGFNFHRNHQLCNQHPIKGFIPSEHNTKKK